ncbi:MAG TPA: hypothetical protein VI776_13945 [Anaerolineales bacterium]|nr:hypothetical protein [Anaerolineales bacterium]
MEQKRILVESGLLLGEGVESLLSQAEDFEVFRTPFGDREALIRAIRRLHPDTVVMTKVDGLSEPIQVFQVIDDYPDLRVVIVNPYDNSVSIYQKRQVTINRVSDFSALI